MHLLTDTLICYIPIMRKIIGYLLFLFLLLTIVLFLEFTNLLPGWYYAYQLFFHCLIASGIGGIVYCLRAVYLHASVHKNWDNEWQLWYYIRPLLSLIMGGVSFVFLKAGLLILDASQNSDTTNYGFIALSFIAGFNVSKFLSKLEDISQSVWGIEKSRASQHKNEE